MLGAVAAAAIVLTPPGAIPRQTVAEIASYGPRPAGSAAELKVDRLVAAKLRAFGYRVSVKTFRLPHGGVSRNVIGRTPGPPRVAVVAHADGVRAGPAANDNGSAIAAVLEVSAALHDRAGVLVAAHGLRHGFACEQRQDAGGD